MAIMRVAEVEMSVAVNPNSVPDTTIVAIIKTSASPAGIAFLRIFSTNLPRIISLFGSCESKKPGTPIVNMLMRDIWLGTSG